MLQAGELLQGRYQLQESLGKNAGRETWIAVDRGVSPREKVIVKFLAFSPEMQFLLMRFSSARKALLSLQKPVLVSSKFRKNKDINLKQKVNYGRLICLSLSGIVLSFLVVFGVVYTFVNSIDRPVQRQDRID